MGKEYKIFKFDVWAKAFEFLWKFKLTKLLLKIALVAGILLIFTYLEETFYSEERKFLKFIINVILAIVAVIVIEVNALRRDNEKSNLQLENKIYRKLVSTNAIISNKDHKLSITARLLNDFPDEEVYKDPSINKFTSESIDVVRILSYQNLLLTPQYLEYFFYRKDSVSNAVRIVVIDRDHLNGRVCQATLTYLFLSARYGYETYVISEIKFKRFIRSKCKDLDDIKMMKGNPFMLKTDVRSDVPIYDGEYIDYQQDIENNGKNVDFKGIDKWNLMSNLKDNSYRITAKTNGFQQYIKSTIVVENNRDLV